MSVFNYTIISKEGRKVEGKRNAETKEEVIQYLIEQGVTIISVREDLLAGFRSFSSIDIGGVPLSERVLIAKQLATMISAGIPIIQAIDILKDQSEKQSLKEKFEKIYKKIEAGSQLSLAFKEVGGILSEVQINLISAGEKSGNLNEMLLKVAEDMEKSKNLRGKLLGALIYPAIIMVVMVIILTVMIAFMIPQVKSLYESLGASELPFITQLLVNISTSIGNPFTILVLVVLAVTGFLAYKNYVGKPSGKLVVDRLRLKIPVFGSLIVKIQLTEFCRLISMLTKSGVPIIEAIEIVARAMSNQVYTDILTKAKDEVVKGTSLALSIAKHNDKEAFPSILVKVIATGEDSGKLDKVLEDMYKYYEAEVEQITSNLTKLMEPFILVIVGGLVAFLAIAIYLPIYQVGNIIN